MYFHSEKYNIEFEVYDEINEDPNYFRPTSRNTCDEWTRKKEIDPAYRYIQY